MKSIHRSRSLTVLATALALALPFAGAVDAQAEELGRLIFTTGEVRIVGQDGQSRPAKQGDLIEPGERLVTGGNALAQVKMLDGGRVGVRPDSSIAFDPPALAVHGAPNVLTLVSGDVRVLNLKLTDKLDPKEYILKTSDGMIQLDRADTTASLRAPTTGSAGTPKETLVRLSAGSAVASNKGGMVRDMSIDQLVAMTPTDLKTGAAGAVPTPPRISTRATATTDALSQKVALTTPLENPGKGTFAVRGPLPGAYGAPAGFSTSGYRLDPKVFNARPPATRPEAKLTPDPITTQPLRPVAPPAQVAAVQGGQLPKLVVPQSTASSFTVTAPTISRTLTPVISGTTLKALPSTIKLPTTVTTTLKR